MNGEALVPQGKDGTGAAFIYPNDAPHPSQIILANRAFAEQQKKEEQARMAKTMEGLDKDLGSAWDVDAPYLQSVKDDIITANASIYKAGQDPTDPRNEHYWNIKKLVDGGKQGFATSNQHMKMYVAHDLESKSPGYADKYDVEAEDELWNAWRDMGPDRANTQPPGHIMKPYNPAKAQKEFLSSIGKPDVVSEPWAKGDQVGVEKITEYSPFQKIMNGQRILTDPNYDKWNTDKYNTEVSPEDDALMQKQADDFNKETPGHGVDKYDIFSSRVLEANYNREQEITAHNRTKDSDGNGGSGNSENDAEDLINKVTRVATGEGFEDTPKATTTFGKSLPGSQVIGRHEIPQGSKISYDLQGLEMGKVLIADGDKTKSVDAKIDFIIKTPDGKTIVYTDEGNPFEIKNNQFYQQIIRTYTDSKVSGRGTGFAGEVARIAKDRGIIGKDGVERWGQGDGKTKTTGIKW